MKQKNPETYWTKKEGRTASFCLNHAIFQAHTVQRQEGMSQLERVLLTRKGRTGWVTNFSSLSGHHLKDLLWFPLSRDRQSWDLQSWLRKRKKSRGYQCQPCSAGATTVHSRTPAAFITEETKSSHGPPENFTRFCPQISNVPGSSCSFSLDPRMKMTQSRATTNPEWICSTKE